MALQETLDLLETKRMTTMICGWQFFLERAYVNGMDVQRIKVFLNYLYHVAFRYY
jgi:hypothetical protein